MPFSYPQGCIYKFADELRDQLNILAAVGSGICVVQLFGLVLACCLYVKLRNISDNQLWHKDAASPGDMFADELSADSLSLIYGQQVRPPQQQSTAATTVGLSAYSPVSEMPMSQSETYPTDVQL